MRWIGGVLVVVGVALVGCVAPQPPAADKPTAAAPAAPTPDVTSVPSPTARTQIRSEPPPPLTWHGTLAATDTISDNEEIVLVDGATGTITNLTNHPADDSRPSWSPDGNQLAFISDRDGHFGIYTMTADGSNVRFIYPTQDIFSDLIWAPHGEELAFIERGFAMNEQISVTVMSALDGAATTVMTTTIGGYSRLAWSPEGSQLAVSLGNGVQVMSAETWQVQFALGGWMGSWSPDGNQIAVAGREGIVVYDRDGRNSAVIRKGYTEHIDWSPKGSWLAFTDIPGVEEPTPKIHIIRPDGTEEQQVTFWVGRNDISPQWSPDGRYIAYCAGLRGGSGSALAIVDRAGTGGDELSVTCDAEWRPARWAHGGSGPPEDCRRQLTVP